MVGQHGNTVKDNTEETRGKMSSTMVLTMFEYLSQAQCDWCVITDWD